MDIDTVKHQLSYLVEKINQISSDVNLEFHQQNVTKKHMCIKGCNGSIWIQPTLNGYDISLSGISLEKEMYGFMKELYEKECDGYKQLNKRIDQKKAPFWKVSNYEMMVKAVYRYAGLRFIKNDQLPEEILSPNQYFEGASKTITINTYERNNVAREKCIEKYGYKCSVCTFDFEKVYGDFGKEYVHVHHLVPLSQIGKEYYLDPVKDLRPVCPNCHAMIHRTQPALSIEQVKEIIRNNI